MEKGAGAAADGSLGADADVNVGLGSNDASLDAGGSLVLERCGHLHEDTSLFIV